MECKVVVEMSSYIFFWTNSFYPEIYPEVLKVLWERVGMSRKKKLGPECGRLTTSWGLNFEDKW